MEVGATIPVMVAIAGVDRAGRTRLSKLIIGN
jgi:hypothetical protein